MNPFPSPTIVFDLGGVLLDWNARNLYIKVFDGDAAAMEKFLAEVDFPAWNAQLDGGHPFAEGIAELSVQFPHYADQIRLFQPRWQETIAGAIEPTVEILRKLKAAGYPLYALSNWSAETYPLMQARYEFLSWFEKVVISGELGLIKPDERIFRRFLEIAGRPAGDCLFIDDSQANIAAATRLGFQTILFLSPDQLAEELSRKSILRQR